MVTTISFLVLIATASKLLQYCMSLVLMYLHPFLLPILCMLTAGCEFVFLPLSYMHSMGYF
ncbi:hypothetical protein HD554DRAFT_2117314 [Boletus coccyginus]|nr:hypothetical protein HD554DRAFT_2117314 [Boletus coccyginus]